MSTEQRSLADYVKKRRLELGIKTQSELAERMGPDVSVSYVGSIEAGRTAIPRQPFLSQLAKALDVSEIEILFETGVMSGPAMRELLGESTAPVAYPVGDPRRDLAFYVDKIKWEDDRLQFVRGILKTMYDYDQAGGKR